MGCTAGSTRPSLPSPPSATCTDPAQLVPPPARCAGSFQVSSRRLERAQLLGMTFTSQKAAQRASSPHTGEECDQGAILSPLAQAASRTLLAVPVTLVGYNSWHRAESYKWVTKIPASGIALRSDVKHSRAIPAASPGPGLRSARTAPHTPGAAAISHIPSRPPTQAAGAQWPHCATWLLWEETCGRPQPSSRRHFL